MLYIYMYIYYIYIYIYIYRVSQNKVSFSSQDVQKSFFFIKFSELIKNIVLQHVLKGFFARTIIFHFRPHIPKCIFSKMGRCFFFKFT